MGDAKTRPILFSGDMARAILDGRKTQTRRPIKQFFADITQVCDDGTGGFIGWQPGYREERVEFTRRAYANEGVRCPYGVPGDRLWVRETWADGVRGCPGGLSYRADHRDPRGDGPANPMRWRSSRHMPRWASRLTLEVLDVRVERVQDIMDDDAKAEGILCDEPGHGADCGPRALFRELWSATYGAASWDANPWVWAVTFRRVP